MAAARAPLVDRSRVVDSPWGPIEYADVGAGTPVLFIHGSGGGFDQGLAFSAPLTGQDVRIIAPSRFGYLRSAMPPDATVEMQADALDWLMQWLGVEQAVIFGGSAGALAATQLALRHPEQCRGLVLAVPALYAPDRLPGANAAPDARTQQAINAALGSDLLFWAGIRAAPDAMTRMVLATDPATVKAASARERERVREVMFHILPVSARREGLLMDSATAGAPPAWPVERITCPTLVIGARGDLYETDKAAIHTAGRIRGRGWCCIRTAAICGSATTPNCGGRWRTSSTGLSRARARRPGPRVGAAGYPRRRGRHRRWGGRAFRRGP